MGAACMEMVSWGNEFPGWAGYCGWLRVVFLFLSA